MRALAVAAFLARSGFWLEVVYAAAAVWGLLPVLAIQRRGDPGPAAAPEKVNIASAEVESRAGT